MNQLNIPSHIFCSNCNIGFEGKTLKNHPCVQSNPYYSISTDDVGLGENCIDSTKKVYFIDKKTSKLYRVIHKVIKKAPDGNSTNSSQAGPESSEIQKSNSEISQLPSLLSVSNSISALPYVAQDSSDIQKPKSQINRPAILTNSPDFPFNYSNDNNNNNNIIKNKINNNDNSVHNDHHQSNIRNSNKSSDIPNHCLTKPIGAGLINIHNSCFMNSVIQLLAHLPPFLEWIYNNYHHTSHAVQARECCTCALYDVISSCSNDKLTPFTPNKLFNLMKDVLPKMVAGEQADAHEYLLSLLYRINSEQKTEHQLESIFLGSFCQSTYCSECCNSRAFTFDFWDIQLSIHNLNTIEEALDQYFDVTPIPDYDCFKCSTKGHTNIQTSIAKMPNVLILQLKRFNSTLSKVSKVIQYSKYIDLIKYAVSEENSENVQMIYRFVGLIVHDGMSLKNGHYYSVIKNYNGDYYKFNDEKVEKVTEESVFEMAPYLLIYRKIIDPVLPRICYLSRYRKNTKSNINSECDIDLTQSSDLNEQPQQLTSIIRQINTPQSCETTDLNKPRINRKQLISGKKENHKHNQPSYQEMKRVKLSSVEPRHSSNSLIRSLTMPQPEIDEMLINEVKKHPVIYNFNLNYGIKTKELQEKAWQEISTAMKGLIQPAVARLRWESLRKKWMTMNSNEIKKANTTGAAAEVNDGREWDFKKSLSFLTDTTLTPETRSNYDRLPDADTRFLLPVTPKPSKGKQTSSAVQEVLPYMQEMMQHFRRPENRDSDPTRSRSQPKSRDELLFSYIKASIMSYPPDVRGKLLQSILAQVRAIDANVEGGN